MKLFMADGCKQPCVYELRIRVQVCLYKRKNDIPNFLYSDEIDE